MLKINKHSDNRVDLELGGKLNAQEMSEGLDDLIEQSKDVSHGRMLYKISDISLPTLGALGVEMTRIPKLFGLLSKFDKCAVLTDSSWLRTAAAVEGALMPGMEIKSFGVDELDAAEAWLKLGA